MYSNARSAPLGGTKRRTVVVRTPRRASAGLIEKCDRVRRDRVVEHDVEHRLLPREIASIRAAAAPRSGRRAVVALERPIRRQRHARGDDVPRRRAACLLRRDATSSAIQTFAASGSSGASSGSRDIPGPRSGNSMSRIASSGTRTISRRRCSRRLHERENGDALRNLVRLAGGRRKQQQQDREQGRPFRHSSGPAYACLPAAFRSNGSTIHDVIFAHGAAPREYTRRNRAPHRSGVRPLQERCDESVAKAAVWSDRGARGGRLGVRAGEAGVGETGRGNGTEVRGRNALAQADAKPLDPRLGGRRRGRRARSHLRPQHPDFFNARTEIGSGTNPPTSECCTGAPAVLEYDAAGTVVGHWGGAGEGYDWPTTPSGIAIDPKGDVWIGGTGGSDTRLLKFSHDGKFIMQVRQSRDGSRVGGSVRRRRS